MSSTAEQRAKWRAKSKEQREAKKKALLAGKKPAVRRYVRRDPAPHHDAIVFLKHAEREINQELRTGKIKKLGKSGLLTLLALSALTEGERAP